MNLYVKSISKSIKGEKVLDDISYTFESGKIYGIEDWGQWNLR